MLSVHDASPSVVAANAKIALWMPPYPEDENYNAAWLVTVELLRSGTHTSSDLGTRGRMAVHMDTTRLISSTTASEMSSRSTLRRITIVSRWAFKNSRIWFNG